MLLKMQISVNYVLQAALQLLFQILQPPSEIQCCWNLNKDSKKCHIAIQFHIKMTHKGADGIVVEQRACVQNVMCSNLASG